MIMGMIIQDSTSRVGKRGKVLVEVPSPCLGTVLDLAVVFSQWALRVLATITNQWEVLDLGIVFSQDLVDILGAWEFQVVVGKAWGCRARWAA